MKITSYSTIRADVHNALQKHEKIWPWLQVNAIERKIPTWIRMKFKANFIGPEATKTPSFDPLAIKVAAALAPIRSQTLQRRSDTTPSGRWGSMPKRSTTYLDSTSFRERKRSHWKKGHYSLDPASGFLSNDTNAAKCRSSVERSDPVHQVPRAQRCRSLSKFLMVEAQHRCHSKHWVWPEANCTGCILSLLTYLTNGNRRTSFISNLGASKYWNVSVAIVAPRKRVQEAENMKMKLETTKRLCLQQTRRSSKSVRNQRYTNQSMQNDDHHRRLNTWRDFYLFDCSKIQLFNWPNLAII